MKRVLHLAPRLWAWTVILAAAIAAHANAPSGTAVNRLAEAVQRRFRTVRAAGDAGLTTVEVAIITAVLLGLATALLAAITVVVNRNMAKIT